MKIDAKMSQFNPKRNMFALCTASFIIISGYSVIVPFLPIYANDILSEFNIFGITIGIALQIGLIAAGNLLMKFILAPAYGDLSDITGRKPIILVGMSVYTFLMAGYGLANDFSSLFILRVLSGVASAAVWPVGEALVVDTSDKNKTGRNLGFYMLSMMLGLTTGPFIGFGFFYWFNLQGLTVLDSYRLTFVGVALLGLIATIFLLFFVTDPKTSSLEQVSLITLYTSSLKQLLIKTLQSPIFLLRTLKSAGGEYRTRNIYTIYVVAAVNGFGTAMLIPIMALFLEEYYLLDTGSIALIIGIVGLLALFGAPTGGILSDKIGRKTTVVGSGLVIGFVIPLLGFKMSLPALILVFVLLRTFTTVMQPSFRALQSDLIPEDVRGKEFGVVQASFNFGSFLGPIIGGYLYDMYFMVNSDLGNGLEFLGAGITFVASGILAIIAAILILVLIDQKTIKIEDKPLDLIPN
ncbi:MAG: MFS transporter [Candidatus Hodarchaeales archaeon]|jgi:DHA1 family multidrug resistance protein-like MFS transporter